MEDLGELAEAIRNAEGHVGSSHQNPLSANLTLLYLFLASVSNNKSSNSFKREYDYIIIGGGSAGAVMASRLSEKSCVSVLLLEAGGRPPLLTDVPAFVYYFLGTGIDWKYNTTPQRYPGISQTDKRVTWNSGKVLGGGSVLNAMMYIRGNKKNYDDWAAEGADGWSYKDVLPYFKKLEDNRNIKELDPGYHSVGGPQTAEKPDYNPEMKEPLMKAFNALGYETLDVNGKKQTGVFDLQATTRDQRRCSTTKAYLDDIRDRPNLDILLHAFAKKILMKNDSNGESTAYGVEFDRFNVTHTVRARSEIIVSSGTIRTPQILMLSGIGPKEQLKKFNINMVADLPVGQNLQDHSKCTLRYTVNGKIMPLREKLLNPNNIADYIYNGSGPYSSPAHAFLLAFTNGLNTTDSRDFPGQELYFLENKYEDSTDSNNRTEGESNERPHRTKPAYVCLISLLQPYSRGEITLNSIDPYAIPDINPNYYEDERDVQTIVEGMKACQAAAEHPEMQEIQPQLVRNMYPVCEKFYNSSNMTDYFSCYVRQKIETIWHFAGTARMGSRNDTRSVVDTELRVIGVKNLRAVSGAVLPIIPSGNTNVPIIMVAEKASDIIKRDVEC